MPKIIKTSNIKKTPGRPRKGDETKEDEPDEPINNLTFSFVKMVWGRHIVEL